MTSDPRVFFDTNVLVYLFDRHTPDKQATAKAVFDREAGAGRLVLSTQVLQEFYVIATRKLKLPVPPDRALAAVRGFAEYPVVQVDSELILEAAERSQQHRIAFWDALIIAAALAGGCRRLVTEDLQDGRRFGTLVIENPFAAA